MRIGKLELLAFGPFRGLELDLSAPGVHVVFGRNEAGKSTTLRAITGLLYGIDGTRDAHVHQPADLRIGGTLIGEAGESMRVVRRRGKTNTLLDDRGQAVDDAVLLRLLRGLTKETFRSAFGLDHETLRHGAQALLDGKGDLGESLFDASVGGGGEVQRLLAALEKEADALWSPRGKVLPLNDALRTFTEAQRAIREKESRPEAHVAQERELEQTKGVRASKVHEKNDLVRKRSAIDAARKRVPLERRRAALAAERASLATAAEHSVSIEALARRIAEHERALEQKKRLASELAAASARVEEAGRRAGVDPQRVKDTMRLDAPKEARIFKLATERERIAVAIAKAKAEVERQERALARLAAETPVLREQPTDDAAIARALERARALGDLETRIATERTKVERRRRELETKAAALGGHSHALDALCELDVPSLAEVEELARRADAADRAVTRAEDEHGEHTRDLDDVLGQIAESEGGFAPPGAAELRGARAARDEKWAALRAAQTPIERIAAESAFETAAREVDGIVDRMLAEADRVTALGRLRARREHLTGVRTKAEAELERHRAARRTIDEELRARFAKVHVAATTAPAMRSWLVDRAAIVDARAALVEHERELADSVARVEAARRELAEALGANVAGKLAELVADAARRVQAAEDVRRAAMEASKQRARIEEEIETRKAALGRDEEAFADAGKKLAELASLVGVSGEASADEIKSAVDSMRDLFDAIDARVQAVAAAKAIDDDIASFEEQVRRIARAAFEDLAEAPPLEAARALERRRQRVLELERDVAEIDARLAELGEGELPEDVAALAGDSEAAAQAIEDLDANLDVLEREIQSLSQKIGGIEAGLGAMRGDSNAADAAAQAEEALARVRTNVERWARAKLAAVLLAREIERYREENQGPMLGRASSLFARLTLGAYTGLKAGFDDRDRPALRLVRAGGIEVDVTALSEGTRDQLYLALRLASLLRHADIAEPMPLVLDDVLVHFDDDRSAAALSVLAEVSRKVQVLFFTHHARLVDLAREAIPAGELVVHELGSRTSPSLAEASP